ncbi:hypothetical protein MTO96_049490 [Rhipicephalus appendiculatus]
MDPRRCSSDSVYKMGPWSGRLRDYAAYLVANHPNLCPSVNQLFSNLRYLRSILSHGRVNHDRSCTAGAPEGCYVLAELSLWNEFLWVANFELREFGPGRLALACLRGRVVPNRVRHAAQALVRANGLRLSRNLRHVKLCYYLLDDHPLRDLIDALSSNVSTLDTVEIVSVRFSGLGIRMLCELLVSCQALRTLVFLENWIDALEAEALIRCCAAHRTLRKLHVDELFCDGRVLSRAGRHGVSKYGDRRVRGELLPGGGCTSRATVSQPYSLRSPTGASRSRRFELYNFVLNETDLRDLSRAMSGGANVKRLSVMCTAASSNLRLSLAPVIYSNTMLAEIYVSGCLVHSDDLAAVAKAIEGNVTLKKLCFSQACFTGDAALPFVDAMSVNWTLQLLSIGTVRQPGLSNFSKQVSDKDLRSRIEFNGLCLATDDLVACLQHGPKTSHVTFEPTAPLTGHQLPGTHAVNDYEQRDYEQNVFEIRDALRRNLSLLQQATRFVVPPCCNSKAAAAAFEKVRESRALLANVMELAGLTEAEAAEAINHRRRYLDTNFLVLAWCGQGQSRVLPCTGRWQPLSPVG